MKIKLAILENDEAYLGRLVAMFNSKYANELEIYSFTDTENAAECLKEKKIDVFLCNSLFKIDSKSIPSRCGFAYFVDSPDIEKIGSIKAVCKFQRIDALYKQILSIYSEQAPDITGGALTANSDMKTIIFTSPAGGTGTSTAAAACAISCATKGLRTLYVNGEVYGEADTFFECDGQFNFGDVIYAVKSNKTNRAMKLQSTLKQDVSTGVYFYSSVRIALDMMEMTKIDYSTLIEEFMALGMFDIVIIDMDFPKTVADTSLLTLVNSIVCVVDSSDNSMIKTDKALTALNILDEDSQYRIIPRMWILKNKSASSDRIPFDVRFLGTLPLYQPVASQQIARQLSLSNIFDSLLK